MPADIAEVAGAPACGFHGRKGGYPLLERVRFLAIWAPIVVVRLRSAATGEIRGNEGEPLGTYSPNQPFRVRIDVDVTAQVWSAASQLGLTDPAMGDPIVNFKLIEAQPGEWRMSHQHLVGEQPRRPDDVEVDVRPLGGDAAEGVEEDVHPLLGRDAADVEQPPRSLALVPRAGGGGEVGHVDAVEDGAAPAGEGGEARLHRLRHVRAGAYDEVDRAQAPGDPPTRTTKSIPTSRLPGKPRSQTWQWSCSE